VAKPPCTKSRSPPLLIKVNPASVVLPVVLELSALAVEQQFGISWLC
jgi:hypothetical protein